MADDIPKLRTPEYPETEGRKKLSKKQRAELILRQAGKCAICACKLTQFEADHRIELWEGGTNDHDNWQALCGPCHDAKTGKAAKRRAKQNRLRGLAGQRARREKNGPSLVSRNTFTDRVRIGKNTRAPARHEQNLLSPHDNRETASPGRWQSRGFDTRLKKHMDGSVSARKSPARGLKT